MQGHSAHIRIPWLGGALYDVSVCVSVSVCLSVRLCVFYVCYSVYDAVLWVFVDFTWARASHGYSVTADFPSEEYIRPHFLVSDVRPDVIMWSTGSIFCSMGT